MNPLALIALSNVYARRLAAAWQAAAEAYPQCVDPGADEGLLLVWAALAGVPEALAEEHGGRLLALGLCRRDGTLADEAQDMMNRLTPAVLAASVMGSGGRRGAR